MGPCCCSSPAGAFSLLIPLFGQSWEYLFIYNFFLNLFISLFLYLFKFYLFIYLFKFVYFKVYLYIYLDIFIYIFFFALFSMFLIFNFFKLIFTSPWLYFYERKKEFLPPEAAVCSHRSPRPRGVQGTPEPPKFHLPTPIFWHPQPHQLRQWHRDPAVPHLQGALPAL